MQFNFHKNKFFGALMLDVLFPKRLRLLAKVAVMIVLLLTFVAWTYQTFIASQHLPFGAPAFPPLPIGTTRVLGLLFFAGAAYLLLFALDRFYTSLTYTKNGNPASENTAERFNFHAAELWFVAAYVRKASSVGQFLAVLYETSIGANTLLRLGIVPEEYQTFIQNYQSSAQPVSGTFASLAQETDPTQGTTASALLAALFRADAQLREWLLSRQVNEQDLRSTAAWMERTLDEQDKRKRWWSLDRLVRIRGIAKTWAYGPTFTIRQFGYDMKAEALNNPLHLVGRDRDIKLLEDALLKQAGANVLIVGEPGTGKETLLRGLTQMIIEGKVFPELESKRIYRVSGPSIVATGKTKGETEALLIKIMNEAVHAGDLILVIEDFPEFAASLEALGVIPSQILAPYLENPNLHIIGLGNTSSFRRHVENEVALMKLFEKIELTEPDEPRLLVILQDVTPVAEVKARNRVIITYPALRKIAEAGIRYLTNGMLPERAVSLLEEIIDSTSILKQQTLVDPEMVMSYVTGKTKIPLGGISNEEQDKLLHLEDRLHERVINQVEAINAIADTIRRARAGIQEPKRPIGSFLFLGPTGVGKTETAKALAAVYFESEERMIRFDMTEYQTDEGLERLLGSFDKNQPGLLATQLRSNPYAVVLLDEFEKADRKVLDLFLQILDEGFFTDAFGNRVNMRNTIIIATSNAGAQAIWEMVSKGINPVEKKADLIRIIQDEGKFRPELLNRFDATIIFQPLSEDHLQKVARLMLTKLADRLKKSHDIVLQITDDMIAETVRQGYDPTFGARPMHRYIQEHIEKIIAEKIIRAEIKRGSIYSLSSEDLK